MIKASKNNMQPDGKHLRNGNLSFGHYQDLWTALGPGPGPPGLRLGPYQPGDPGPGSRAVHKPNIICKMGVLGHTAKKSIAQPPCDAFFPPFQLWVIIKWLCTKRNILSYSLHSLHSSSTSTTASISCVANIPAHEGRRHLCNRKSCSNWTGHLHLSSFFFFFFFFVFYPIFCFKFKWFPLACQFLWLFCLLTRSRVGVL